jgi:hypothetical protein
MPVQLGEQCADFLSPPPEQRKHCALKVLGQIANSGVPHRPVHHREGTWFSVAVSASV